MDASQKLYVLIYSFISYLIVGLASIFVSENLTHYEHNSKTLYDVIHRLTPAWPNMFVPTLLVIFYFLYIIVSWIRVDLNIISLYFVSLSLIQIIRLFTFTLTQTPPPQKKDNEWRIDHCKRHILNYIGISFRKANVCVDNMFSGHTAHIIAALTIVFLYSSNNIEKLLLSILAAISVIFIITSRLHYTVDVIVSIVISSLMVYFLSKNINYLIFSGVSDTGKVSL